MEPFIFFAIILTIAYVLYYLGLIAVDLTAKPKQEGGHEETILMENSSNKEKDEEPAPQTVSENPETGGFDIVKPGIPTEKAPEKIAEAESTPVAEEEKKEDETASKPQPNEETQVHKEAASEDPAPETSSESESEETPANPPVPSQASEPTEPEEHPEEDEPEEQEDLGASNISIVDFSDAPLSPQVHTEPFDINKAFDPDKLQPQYGVSEVYEAKPDPLVQKLTDGTNLKMENISVKEAMMGQQDFLEQVRNKNNETNIEHQNEYVNM